MTEPKIPRTKVLAVLLKLSGETTDMKADQMIDALELAIQCGAAAVPCNEPAELTGLGELALSECCKKLDKIIECDLHQRGLLVVKAVKLLEACDEHMDLGGSVAQAAIELRSELRKAGVDV